MRRRLVAFGVGWLTVVGLSLAVRSAWGACARDTDCKGDRICQAGLCVSPSPPAAAPADAAACAKDTDCKGDRICSGGQCTTPGATTPAPPPTAPVQAAPEPVSMAPAPPPPTTDATPAPAAGSGRGGGSGISLAIRAGYAIPLGQSQQSANLSDEISGMVPFWFDAGYLFNPSIFFGLYFQYGPGLTTSKTLSPHCNASSLPAGVQSNCFAHDVRFGGEFHYHLLPRATFDPWIGAGFGYEWATEVASSAGKSGSQSGDGFEFINFQAGADFKIVDSVGIGPFLALTVGQFGNYSVDTSQVGGSKVSGSITDKALHEWVFLGIRGVFDIYFH